MKLFNKRNTKVSKKFALKAVLYRRLVIKHTGVPKNHEMFSKEKLIEMYEFESTGKTKEGFTTFTEMKKNNGYAFGKWLRDIDVANIREDIESGLFAKIEFLSTPIEVIHNKDFLETIVIK